MTAIDFSIIIPTYNVSENIMNCIKSVEANHDKAINYDIIVVDNGSFDGTVDIVEKMGHRIIINSDGKGKTIGNLRNIGARHSDGNIIVFLDADMIVPPHWLRKAKEYFNSGFEGALGFFNDVPAEAGWIGKTWARSLTSTNNKVVYVDFLNGSNMFVNRHVFDKVDGFNSSLITGEDKDFTFRILHAGYKAVFLPYPNVIHMGYEKSLWEFIKKEYWRQGYTLDLARAWGYSFRSLRNPLLSLWHVLFISAFSFSLLFSFPLSAVLLIICFWILPALLITGQISGKTEFYRFAIPLFFLTFLRWNVSGLALISQVLGIMER